MVAKAERMQMEPEVEAEALQSGRMMKNVGRKSRMASRVNKCGWEQEHEELSMRAKDQVTAARRPARTRVALRRSALLARVGSRRYDNISREHRGI